LSVIAGAGKIASALKLAGADMVYGAAGAMSAFDKLQTEKLSIADESEAWCKLFAGVPRPSDAGLRSFILGFPFSR
jgi:hypothetical protein